MCYSVIVYSVKLPRKVVNSEMIVFRKSDHIRYCTHSKAGGERKNIEVLDKEKKYLDVIRRDMRIWKVKIEYFVNR